MDWTPYMSGLFALGGAFLGILGTIAAQLITQRNENIRHARKLAYDAGMQEWETHFAWVRHKIETTGGNFALSPPDDFILKHLSFLERLHKISPAQITADDLLPHIENDRRRSYELLQHRKTIEEKLQQERTPQK